MHSLELKIPPPVQWLFFALLAWAAARWLPQGNFPFPGHRLLGAALALAGVACGLLGMLAFGQARTTIDPHHPERTRALVTHGIYSHTRNPMYLGLALVLLGLASWWASAPGLLAVVLFGTGLTHLQIVPEERVLQATFGAVYADYCQRVRRWL